MGDSARRCRLDNPRLDSLCFRAKRETQRYLDSGKKYMNSGKLAEAEIQFRNALEITPRSPEAHYQLARTYRSLKNLDAACRTEVVSLNSADWRARLDLAELLILRGKYQRAQEAVEKAIQADPKNDRAQVILAVKYAFTHDVTDAIRTFQNAIQLNPKRIDYYTALNRSLPKPLVANRRLPVFSQAT